MPTNAGDKAVECKPEQPCEFVVTDVVTRRGGAVFPVATTYPSMHCLAKLSLNLLPNQIAGSASRSGHTPRTRTPCECPPAFRNAPAVAEAGSTMRRSVPQPSAIGQSAAMLRVALR
jgi:hypothetical protein